MSGMSQLWIRNVVAIVFAFSATACGLLPEVKDDTAGWSAERLYKEAHDNMRTNNYTRAVKLFDTLEGRYPYGRYAQQAILEGAYANYRAGETAPAVAACDRFIRTYPNHAFKELVARFPDSKYASDSVERMRYLTNALSSYEVHVADYYYRRGAYVAAANRAQASLLNYPQTPANEDALILMARSYDQLGLTQLRDDAQRVLKETFPNGKYFTAEARPWWNFWSPKEEIPLPPGDSTTTRPWWKFW